MFLHVHGQQLYIFPASLHLGFFNNLVWKLEVVSPQLTIQLMELSSCSRTCTLQLLMQSGGIYSFFFQ